MRYKVILSGEMKVDYYDENESKYIESTFEGDMASERMTSLIIDPRRWPTGTKIKIEVPCCPNCGVDAEYQSLPFCECGFDWRQWAENEYS